MSHTPLPLRAEPESQTVLGTPDQLRRSARKAARLKGRQPDDAACQAVRALIGAAPATGHPRDRLIEHLHLLQDHFKALFERHLVALASEMRLPLAEVLEVASFYHHFDLLRDDELPAALTVRVCESLSCTLSGASDLLARLPTLLGASVRVLPAPCLGRCEQAPAVLVGQQAVPQATEATVLAATAAALGVVQGLVPNRPLALMQQGQAAIELVAYEAYRQQGGYALVQAVARDPAQAEAVLQRMSDSGLRGLGGAGFPAGRKWRIVREQPGPRVLVVNADEGEPGTFKDRTHLERDPHRVLEGMLVAAHIVGAQRCYLYLRDEYHALREVLAREIAALQANPPCALPSIALRRGAGAYICGEESALIESLEGKRGEPRLRPPYIAESGLFGLPTLMHNVETLYWVRTLVERGPAWFAGHGRRARQGLRSFSVSGRVKQPGVKLAPAGISVRELIDEHCAGMQDGHTLYAYLPGGASGGIFPASLADVALDFDTLQPHGGFIGSAAVIVLSQHDRARDAALAMMRFFENESCGQCTPCRVGTAKAAQLMTAPVWDNAVLDDLSDVMQDASICGLGQAAPNPLRCVQQYFAHEIGAADERA